MRVFSFSQTGVPCFTRQVVPIEMVSIQKSGSLYALTMQAHQPVLARRLLFDQLLASANSSDARIGFDSASDCAAAGHE